MGVGLIYPFAAVILATLSVIYKPKDKHGSKEG